MRKQLAEIQEIEQYLQQQMDTENRLVFEARSLISPELENKKASQQKVYSILRWFGRNEKRRQLETLHQQLLQDESFNQSLTAIFE